MSSQRRAHRPRRACFSYSHGRKAAQYVLCGVLLRKEKPVGRHVRSTSSGGVRAGLWFVLFPCFVRSKCAC